MWNHQYCIHEYALKNGAFEKKSCRNIIIICSRTIYIVRIDEIIFTVQRMDPTAVKMQSKITIHVISIYRNLIDSFYSENDFLHSQNELKLSSLQ